MVANNQLERSRHVRLKAELDDELQRLADAEQCSVSDLIRRAIIRTFLLPANATQRDVIEERVATAVVTEEAPDA